MLHALFSIAHYLLWILSIIVIVQVVFSWLFAFNVLNSSSQVCGPSLMRWTD
jgi:hypothetical protein